MMKRLFPDNYSSMFKHIFILLIVFLLLVFLGMIYSFGNSLTTSILITLPQPKVLFAPDYALPIIEDSHVFSKAHYENRTHERKVQRMPRRAVSILRCSAFSSSRVRMSSFFSSPVSVVIFVCPLIRIQDYCRRFADWTVLWTIIEPRTSSSSTPAIPSVEISSLSWKPPLAKFTSSMSITSSTDSRRDSIHISPIHGGLKRANGTIN